MKTIIRVLYILTASLILAGCQTPKLQQTSISSESVLDPTQPISTPAYYLYKFTDEEVFVSDSGEDLAKAQESALKEAIVPIKARAFIGAANEINSTLSKPIESAELKRMAVKASREFPDYIKEFKLTDQGYQPSLELAVKGGTMVFSGFFKIDRQTLKSALISATEATLLKFGEDEVLAPAAPASTPSVYVASYQDMTRPVPENIKDRNEARRTTIALVVEEMKKRAFGEAAEEINHALAQPMNRDEFSRAISKAIKNYDSFISEWKITRQVVDTRGPLSTQPETVRVSAWFSIDKAKLRKSFVKERAIVPVAKYRAYVELFWNVPDKDIHPEVVMTVIGNVEDRFRQAGYEVVEFERIKGDLVSLLKSEGSTTDDLLSSDELERFKANLELRKIDKRFTNGKRILADYADLLVGVTINAVEVNNHKLTVRLTTNATLIERGEWLKLGSSDRSGSVPYVRGSTDNLIGLAKKLAIVLADNLESKVRKELSLRKAREEIRMDELRDFTLLFKGSDKDGFDNIKRRLKQGSKWAFKGADFSSRMIHLTFSGQIDSLSELIQIYLEGAGIKAGIGEYNSQRNRILFSEQ